LFRLLRRGRAGLEETRRYAHITAYDDDSLEKERKLKTASLVENGY
jgi:hypothetical protein